MEVIGIGTSPVGDWPVTAVDKPVFTEGIPEGIEYGLVEAGIFWGWLLV